VVVAETGEELIGAFDAAINVSSRDSLMGWKLPLSDHSTGPPWLEVT
jgi:hypothetical protein